MSKTFATNPKPKGKGKNKPAAEVPAAAETPSVEKIEKALDADPAAGVTLESNTNPAPVEAPAPANTETAATPSRRPMNMETLKLTISTAPRKSKRLVIYNIEGRTGSVQFLSTLFGGSQTDPGTPPASLELSGEFATPKPKAVPRASETPEERKARLAALPKLTLEEKVAKQEERTNALRAKLAAQKAAAEAAAATAPASTEVH